VFRVHSLHKTLFPWSETEIFIVSNWPNCYFYNFDSNDSSIFPKTVYFSSL
jgi:hypothetical protein